MVVLPIRILEEATMIQESAQDKNFRIGLRLAYGSLVGFLLLTFLAMLVYPGGTNTDPEASRYVFTENFFSDLGRVSTFKGGPNTASSVLFVTALFLAATGQTIYLALKWETLANQTRWLTMIGCIFGSLTAIGQIGVAMTPWDILGKIHLNFVYLLFCSFLASVTFFTLAIFKTDHYPRQYGWFFIAFALLLTGYISLLFFGPKASTHAGLMIQATGQKIIVYAHAICLAVQLFGLRQYSIEKRSREAEQA